MRDSGIGIAKDKYATIFGVFSQADESTTRKYGGTGLGLAICKRIVELMGGSIVVSSEVGKGSTFSFSVRVEVVPQAGAERSSFGARRVLLAARNGALRHCVGRQLRSLGLDVRESASGDELLARLQEAQSGSAPYDWLLMDAAMPAPGGYALAEKLIRGWPRLDRMIMMLDPNTQRGDSVKCEHFKVGARLVKPFSEPDLVDALRLSLQGGVVVADARFLAYEPAASLATARGGRTYDILLVEDNPVNQTVAVKMLERAGHSITLAANGQEAVEYFDDGHFDLILMDVQMPVMGGFEATQAIRSREARRSWAAGGQWRFTPIVAMTAHAMQGDRDRCLMAGMDDYIAKPLKPAELFATIERVMNEGGGQSAVESEPCIDLGGGEVANLAATLELLDGDESALQQLISLFFTDLERNRKALEQAQRTNDFAGIRNLAHSIKGAAGVFHAEAVVAVAQRLELAGKSEDGAGVGRETPELLSALGTLAGVLRMVRKAT